MTALTLEPASACAVARCLVSRLQGKSPSHPRPCAWEDWTRQELADMLADFNEAAGYDDRWNRYRHVDAERFHALPRDEQARRIHAAQYPEVAA